MNLFRKILTAGMCAFLAGLLSANAQIIQAEYFIDTDPGQGSATAMTAVDGTFNNVLESAIKTAISVSPVGIHSINIRVKDTNNNWGPVFKTVIHVQNAFSFPTIKIAAAEYFWDTDPGQGSATAMIAFDGNFSDALEAVIKSAASAPALGFHKLNIRVKDVNNNWGPVFTTVVHVQSPYSFPSIKITAAEYFWDTDPGQGAATSMLAFDSNFSDALESVIKSAASVPALGFHKLCIRAKDVNNNWGPVFTTVVNVQTPYVFPSIKITAAEYFWDADPGQGNGTTMLAFDGSYSDAVETALKNDQNIFYTQGIHKVSVRALDVQSNWSPVFTVVVYLDPCITVPVVNATAQGSTSFCLGGSVDLDATAGFTTYVWRKGNTIIGGNTPSITVTESGNYTVTAVDGNSCPGTSSAVTVTAIQPEPIITPSGALVFCEGGSVTLNAGSFTTYLWSNGATTQTVTASETETFTVTVTDGNGCTNTSSPATVTVNTLPQQPVITQSGADLISDITTNIQWYYNGSPINNATLPTYTPTLNGDYTVVVTDGNNCSATSATYPFYSVGIADFNNAYPGLLVSASPNPFESYTTVYLQSGSFEGNASLFLFDISGQLIENHSLATAQNETKTMRIDGSNLSSGMYIYKLISDQAIILGTGKLIVNK